MSRRVRALLRLAAAILPALAIPLHGQDRPATATTSVSPLDRATLERQFEQMLTGVVLKGTWQMTGAAGLAGKAPLTEPRTERYTILSVEKALEDNWLINARIQFAEKDVTIPIMVRVVWAGDTPVITLDELKMPLLGTYSARVMVYRGFYSGAWFGATYGGVLSGQIVKLEDEAAAASQPAGAPPKVPASP
jgi:hypothetical protein